MSANGKAVIEMFLTAQLVITIFLLAAEKHKGTFLAPVGIGLSLFIAELSGVYFTGGMSAYHASCVNVAMESTRRYADKVQAR